MVPVGGVVPVGPVGVVVIVGLAGVEEEVDTGVEGTGGAIEDGSKLPILEIDRVTEIGPPVPPPPPTPPPVITPGPVAAVAIDAGVPTRNSSKLAAQE